MKKKISILGSTGSVGQNTLAVIESFSHRFEVIGLAAGANILKLSEQIQRFRPAAVSVACEKDALDLKNRFTQTEFFWGEEGLEQLATLPEVDLVMSALVGAVGIKPTWQALSVGKVVALANKEVLVSAGPWMMDLVKEKKGTLLPVDSEHNALFQLLDCHGFQGLEKITLTASGGPFLKIPEKDFKMLTPEQALRHPTWSMGKRISIDSATLMNKGFEVIEAGHLFNLRGTQIEVVVHPQSMIHGLVSYQDGNTLACLSLPDMKIPIAYVLCYPERYPQEVPVLDLTKVGMLTFEGVDGQKFPLLGVAYEILKRGGHWGAVCNAADEVAVGAFLERKIGFHQIAYVVQKTLDAFSDLFSKSLEGVYEADHWARTKAQYVIKMLS
ncbi:MAG: 1-deoxy-D-xylulose-5-phosphate reductoisomerase [Deltaproteobacteria bacterium]|nr:1-deoxy-D-xylulose-5-phosphate reductoisomerase [Deltaproteobacteria bacterium]